MLFNAGTKLLRLDTHNPRLMKPNVSTPCSQGPAAPHCSGVTRRLRRCITIKECCQLAQKEAVSLLLGSRPVLE